MHEDLIQSSLCFVKTAHMLVYLATKVYIPMGSVLGGGVGEAGEWLLLCEGSAGMGPVANRKARKPALQRQQDEEARQVPLPCNSGQCPNPAAIVCPKVCLRPQLNAWNVRLGAILRFFFLLRNRAGCPCNSHTVISYKLCYVMRMAPDLGFTVP